MAWLEIYGYVGSVLVAASLMMSNMKRLRWINLIGAAVFSSYGFLIGAIPVFLLNGWIVLVDIYYLVRLYQFRDQFDMVKLSSVKTPLFELLIQKYGEDVKKYFPDATTEALEDAVAMLIFRNMTPVGLFAYRRLPKEPAMVEALIDYVIPEARDFKTAQFLFNRHTAALREQAINTVISKPSSKAHETYLKRVGFVQTELGWELDLR